MPALIIKLIPINVLNVGISLNNKYPINIDQIINEYSNNETTDGDAIIYAENIHKNLYHLHHPLNFFLIF